MKTDILFFLAKLYEDIDEEHAFNLYQLIYDNLENSPEQHAEAYLYYGDLALKKGDVQSALNAYSNIINSTADSLWILKAKNRISDIK